MGIRPYRCEIVKTPMYTNKIQKALFFLMTFILVLSQYSYVAVNMMKFMRTKNIGAFTKNSEIYYMC